MWEYFSSSSQFLNRHLWNFTETFCFVSYMTAFSRATLAKVWQLVHFRTCAPGCVGDRALLRIVSGKVCWGGKARQREQALRKHASAKLETGNLNPLSFLGQPGQWPRPRHTTTCVGPHTSVPGYLLEHLDALQAGERARELGCTHTKASPVVSPAVITAQPPTELLKTNYWSGTRSVWLPCELGRSPQPKPKPVWCRQSLRDLFLWCFVPPQICFPANKTCECTPYPRDLWIQSGNLRHSRKSHIYHKT